MQHSFFDVTLKFTVLQRHFHKFCDTPSTKIARYLSLLSSLKDISEFLPTRKKLHRYMTGEMYGWRNPSVYIPL